MRDLVKGIIPQPDTINASELSRPIRKKDVDKAIERLAEYEEKMLQDSTGNSRKRKTYHTGTFPTV